MPSSPADQEPRGFFISDRDLARFLQHFYSRCSSSLDIVVLSLHLIMAHFHSSGSPSRSAEAARPVIMLIFGLEI